MASVTFTSDVGGDGSTITDDSNPTTGLASGGHRIRFVPALSKMVACLSYTIGQVSSAASAAAAALSSAGDAAASASAASAAKTAAEAAAAAFNVSALFPVGCVHITANGTNPGAYLPGTWAQIGSGRTLIGVGTLGVDTYNLGDVGGAARHTLTADEMPSHSHGGSTSGASADHTHSGSTSSAGSHAHAIVTSVENNGGSGNYASTSPASTTGSINTSASGDHSHAVTTGGASADHTHAVTVTASGGGQAHENRMPYLAVYFWQRTA